MKIKKEAVVKLLKNNAGVPMEFREMMQAFGISKAERPKFKAIIDGFVDEGALLRLRGRLFILPASGTGLTGKLSVHRDGYGFVMPEEGEDVFIPARYLRENMHGDRVEVQIVAKKRDGKQEGRIVKTLERGFSKLVGRFEKGAKVSRVIPDEVRIGKDIIIPAKAAGKATNGQVVVAEITSYAGAGRSMEGRIIEVLGWPDEPEVEVQTIIRKHELPDVFPPSVLKAARAVPETIQDSELEGRTDLRGQLTVTIDGETAKDFDDAVSVKKEGKGAIRLWVSIADVSHYVKPGSPLDKEAYLRGTSVYFPDRCIPMLPEELSNGICSLNPQVDRLTMTAEMLFDGSGTILEAAFYPSVIRSVARLTYTKVKKIVVDNDPELVKEYAELVPELKTMEELALRLMAKRRKRGSIDFDLPEPEILLDLTGGITAIVRAERNLAHKIIEEFMLAANEAVASHIEERELPFLYRIHETPEFAKLQDFKEFIFNFGYELRLQEEKVSPGEFQRILDQAQGKPEERMINEVLLRCMKQARYSAENVGHFGLAAASYTHFTSPIRRYPDLVVHRILKKQLAKKIGEKDRENLASTLPETGLHTSKRERVAMEAEREIVELKKMQYMQDKVGEELDGIITGVASFGFFVELVEIFVEGMVHISTLKQDFYEYVEKQHALIGERSRTIYRIGDPVRIRVAAVSLEKKQVEFVLARHDERVAPVAEVYGGDEFPKVPVRGKWPKIERKEDRRSGEKDRRDSGSKKGRRRK
ncbi:exoribonuclease R [Geotalea daltonii FRC-32]|uniref:Ribonuclease R n=1 Tax=Geotalea daltonii (strain DSM 22248 / JCM 15807 / FRC-32) TaxID=316067 RepID=B9M5H5_GEODF|nr:ribonuclease R [Geotalea daltonii]ACM21734.1 exoribonuclease R [Geotalea daltonii FRC-32]